MKEDNNLGQTRLNLGIETPDFDNVLSESILTNEHIRTTLQDYYNSSATQDFWQKVEHQVPHQMQTLENLEKQFSRTMLTFPHDFKDSKKARVGPIFQSLTKGSAQRRVNLRYSLAKKNYLRVETQSMTMNPKQNDLNAQQSMNGTQISVESQDEDIQ